MCGRVDAGSPPEVHEAISAEDFRWIIGQHFDRERGMQILSIIFESGTLEEARERTHNAIAAREARQAEIFVMNISEAA